MNTFEVGGKVKHRTRRPNQTATVEKTYGLNYALIKWADGRDYRAATSLLEHANEPPTYGLDEVMGAFGITREELENDEVNSPAHYTAYPIEVIQLTEHLNFCRGSAVKYLARAGLKDPDKEIEDLEKAAWYIQRELNRLKDTP